MLFSTCEEADARTVIEVNKETCDSIKNRALEDYAISNLKYYVFGLVPPNKKITQQLDKCCDVKIVAGNCVFDENIICYNFVVDSIFRSKKQYSISKLLKKAK
jgi:hypothetical protein